MSSKKQLEMSRNQLFIRVGAMLAALVAGLFFALRVLAMADVPTAAADLAYTQIVTNGQDGFTALGYPHGIDRRMVFAGTRNGVSTLYLYDDGVFIEVMPADGTLPGGKGTATSFSSVYRMTPDGDILFLANISGGSLPADVYILRWHNGTITVQQPRGSNLNYMTSDGRWLVEKVSGTSPTQTFAYSLSDGAAETPLISLTSQDTSCHRIVSKVHAANVNGVVAYTVLKTEKSVCSPGARHLTEWEVRLGGTISQTLLTGSFISPAGGNRSGDGVSLQNSILNDNNELLMVLETYDGVTGNTLKKNVIMGSSGGVQTVLFDSSNPQVFASLPTYFDAQGRIATTGFASGFPGPRSILRGDTDNLAQDVVVQEGDPLFGSTLSLLQPVFSAYQNFDLPDENRGFYFTYQLADGTTGIGLAARTIPHWANPNGGNWGTGSNWTPTGVPTTTTEVIFNLPNTYAVNLGVQKIGGVIVSKGNLTLRNGALQVAPFYLAVVGPDDKTIPGLTIGQTGGGDTNILANMNVGPGELVIDNAVVTAPDTDVFSGTVELGALGPATVLVTGGARWNWQVMQVGAGYPTQLRIEQGAFVGNTPAQLMVIGGGSSAGLVDNTIASVVVDDAGNDPGPLGLGTILGASISNLVIGQERIGGLSVTNGGSVFAIVAEVGTLDHGSVTDGSLMVSGVNPARPATFEAGNSFVGDGGLFAAPGEGTNAQIEVLDGGLLRLTSLSLAGGDQSSALMFVDGVNGQHRSSVLAPLEGSLPGPSVGMCVIGQAGQGTLNVSNGGLVECKNIAVGFLPGSVGEVNLGGSSGSFASQMIARGAPVSGGLVCIGSVISCGAPSPGGSGDVNLSSGGLLEGAMVLVGSNGRIRGSGTILALQGVHLIGGSVSPGVTVLTPDVALADLPQRAALTDQAGVLNIQGDLTIDSDSSVVLDIFGATTGLQDSLQVTGTVDLHGRLVINFANGYAPKTGDQFTLIQAAALNGTPIEIVITGLMDGFEYELVLVNGALKLKALNDGQTALRSVFIPFIQR